MQPQWFINRDLYYQNNIFLAQQKKTEVKLYNERPVASLVREANSAVILMLRNLKTTGKMNRLVNLQRKG